MPDYLPDDFDDEEYDGDDTADFDGQPDDLTELSDFEQADEYFTGWATDYDY